jgi:hypothetical protein
MKNTFCKYKSTFVLKIVFILDGKNWTKNFFFFEKKKILCDEENKEGRIKLPLLSGNCELGKNIWRLESLRLGFPTTG